MSLIIENISAGYGRVEALHDVTVAPIPPGQFVGLIGPNASGKSTLFKTLAGVLRPSAGTIRFDDIDLGSLNRRDRARQIAYMPQAYGCNAILTVYESVCWPSSKRRAGACTLITWIAFRTHCRS